jgi:hypothetical protein
MNRKRIQEYRMLTRVVDFGAKHVGLFPKRTVAGDLLAQITAAVTKLPEYATWQVSGHESIRTSSRKRTAAREAVRTQVEAIGQTARALKMQGFSIPTDPKEEDLINSARSFAQAAEPLKEEFIQHGLPPEFVENLNAAVQDLEESLLKRAASQAARSGAIREFNKLLDEALNLLDRFEALVDNTMADNPSVMAAWHVARHVERIPQSKAEPEPEPGVLANQTVPPGGEGAAPATA